VKLINVESTSLGAKLAAERNEATIATEVASKLYKIEVLKKGIENNSKNYTRFIVISKQKSDGNKTSIIFTLKHLPGALYSILEPFAKRKINLTKIESIPLKDKAWEYVFFVDFGGSINEKKVKKTLDEVEEKTLTLKSLGSYPKWKG